MIFTLFGARIDERFLTHRLRSTSFGGIAGGIAAVSLFWYRYFAQHVFSWDLLAVAATIAGVKVAFMLWYHFTD